MCILIIGQFDNRLCSMCRGSVVRLILSIDIRLLLYIVFKFFVFFDISTYNIYTRLEHIISSVMSARDCERIHNIIMCNVMSGRLHTSKTVRVYTMMHLSYAATAWISLYYSRILWTINTFVTSKYIHTELHIFSITRKQNV